MITRREMIHLLSAASVASWMGATKRLMAASSLPINDHARGHSIPNLAPGSPMSPERTALIETFKKQCQGIDRRFEARMLQGQSTMPYRLFCPKATEKLPLVIYLHGSGGLGNDNEKQMGLGNIFGTRVWALPENQEHFPCYVVVPQTDVGWVRYDLSQENSGPAKILEGLGEGVRRAFEVVDSLSREFNIDQRRIYVAGQSMGGAGVWHMLAQRPSFFAAAVICCGSNSTEDGTGSIHTPLWNFHGDSDRTVPVSVSRDRIAARRKAGGQPLYTEYAGVDHNVWQWAFTEPALVKWVFSQRRG